MPHSLSEKPTLTCPECGRQFRAELWLIVDGDERPGLLERLRAGALHQVICPAGHLVQVDAPLLLFRPTAEPPLLFSPAGDTSAAQDRRQAERFLAALRDSLGDDWRDEWLAAGLRTVPRAALPAHLSHDPEKALADLLQRQFKQLPPALRRAFDEVLVALALDGVDITSAAELEQALAARPQLRASLQEAAVANRPPPQA